jgi:hypothetical protein
MEGSEQKPESIFRRILPFTTVGVVLAAIYCGYVFYSRWSEGREVQEKARQQEIADARKTVEAYGNGMPKVMNFTISPSVVHRGDKVSICYGVSNSKTVTIEPKPDDSLWPSLARCVSASPRKDTTYTITAADEKGNSDTHSLMIRVQ